MATQIRNTKTMACCFMVIVGQFILTFSLFIIFSKHIFAEEHIIDTVKIININNNKTEYCFHNKFECDILPLEYRDCFISLLKWNENIDFQTNPKQCSLPSNIEFNVVDKLALGSRAKTYTVKFMNNPSKQVVLKLAKKGVNCRHLKEEYEYLKDIEYMTNNNRINIGYLYNKEQIPYYHWTHSSIYMDKDDIEYVHICFIFIEKVNGLSFESLIYNTSLIPFNNNLLKFTVKCYNDIITVLDQLFIMDLIHKDLSFGNIFVDSDDEKCYLIDFGGLFPINQKNLLHGLAWHRRLYCIIETCSPEKFYFLQTPKDRTDTMEYIQTKYANNSMEQNLMILKRMIYNANKYRLTSYFFKYFIIYYSNVMVENDQRFDGIYRIKTGVAKQRENKIKEGWNIRYELLKLLKTSNNKLIDNPIVDKLFIMDTFDIFDIYENDLLYINNNDSNKEIILFKK